jgi:hypothetical protein
MTNDEMRVAKKAVVILEVMWDWNAMTSGAGYAERAPRYFRINPHNFTGRRLHAWLKGYDFLVTNACPQLVNSSKGRGTPDKGWLRENLTLLQPFDLLMVCGKVAQATYERQSANGARIIEIMHPAARTWNASGINMVSFAIRQQNEFQRVVLRDRQFSIISQPSL